MRVRIRFTKEESVKYLGHLDILRTFQKFMNRAEIGMQYSEGFNPHQKMSFALPLGVGLTSRAEYLDAVIADGQDLSAVKDSLNAVTGNGFEILSVKELNETAAKSMAAVKYADFTVIIRDKKFSQNEIDHFLLQNEIVTEKKSKSGIKNVDIKPMIIDLKVNDNALLMRLTAGSVDNLKPETLLIALYRFFGLEYSRTNCSIERSELLSDGFISLEKYQTL